MQRCGSSWKAALGRMEHSDGVSSRKQICLRKRQQAVLVYTESDQSVVQLIELWFWRASINTTRSVPALPPSNGRRLKRALEATLKRDRSSSNLAPVMQKHVPIWKRSCPTGHGMSGCPIVLRQLYLLQPRLLMQRSSQPSPVHGTHVWFGRCRCARELVHPNQ